MVTTHNLGYPRIGRRRELKTALEAYWKGEIEEAELLRRASDLRAEAWQRQSELDFAPVGDFSLYDHVLDASFLVGNVPERAWLPDGSILDAYFRLARGRSSRRVDPRGTTAGEMTKWFDTNYHYIVPEIGAAATFAPHAEELLARVREARAEGVSAKPVLVGPLTYLGLGKARDGSRRLDLLPELLAVYCRILAQLEAASVEWVQVDEPLLVTELDEEWRGAFEAVYAELACAGPKLLLATYFGGLGDNADLVASLPVQGVHLDVSCGRDDVPRVVSRLRPGTVVSLGVVDGRNVWKTDLSSVLDFLEPLYDKLEDNLWLAPSCSLLHVPVDLASETGFDDEIRSWFAFAEQKLSEVRILSRALVHGRATVESELEESAAVVRARRTSRRVHRREVQAELALVDEAWSRRESAFPVRAKKQAELLRLPIFPTTTIGSFPQTAEMRRARRQLRAGAIERDAYVSAMHDEIAHAVREQEALGLDVLVHGEAERNDMVEYFGEMLEGFVLSEHGWVQSYGSRCVKPPILFGDVSRARPMTLDWIRYAQSLTARPVKGMLTGPVTILNWSFVREDQPRSVSCRQIALAIRKEVLDLERAGIRIIQVDEAAFREGAKTNRGARDEYLRWAAECFRIAVAGVRDETQVHTHMCYSEFNDILESIADMDADVITIETSRSSMELLDAFDSFAYPNAIGPGVYDIHSPNVPDEQQIVALMKKAAERIPSERLWVNPDCGLKTRRWAEVIPALATMVAAAKTLRATL